MASDSTPSGAYVTPDVGAPIPPSHGYRTGDVLRYDSERENRWCREGLALVDDRGRLVDTFWASFGDAHVLTWAEAKTARLLFNLGDYDELPHRSRERWERYAPQDRQVVTSQHGLQVRYFIRKGADPDLDTMIENAREQLRAAKKQADWSARQVEWARGEVARLECERLGRLPRRPVDDASEAAKADYQAGEQS